MNCFDMIVYQLQGRGINVTRTGDDVCGTVTVHWEGKTASKEYSEAASDQTALHEALFECKPDKVIEDMLEYEDDFDERYYEETE